jgi:hypothetical protein
VARHIRDQCGPMSLLYGVRPFLKEKYVEVTKQRRLTNGGVPIIPVMEA